MEQCVICGWFNHNKLCETHKKLYVWDKKINGYRLKKSGRKSRYTTEEYHKSEIYLTKILESYFGSKNVFTSYHPPWAETNKHVLLEYDIFIKPNILIEYNGIQHYVHTKFFHKTKKKFIDQCKRDKKKYKLAKDNGYIIITFKYDEPLIKDYILNKIRGIINGV